MRPFQSPVQLNVACEEIAYSMSPLRQWMRRGVRGVSLLIALSVISWADLAIACPTCGESLSNSHAGVGLGYYWSILFLMSAPFSILAGWVYYIARILRQQRASAAAMAKALNCG
jgi:hypothetical protein